MTAPATLARPGGLVDRRLARRAAVTRRYLVLAVAVGLVSTVCVVAQAVLLATVVDRAMLGGEHLGAVTPLLVGLAVAFAVRALAGWAGEAASHRTSATVTSVLRRDLLAKTVTLGPTWLSGERAGELSVTATRGIAALDVYFGRYLPQAVLAAVAPIVLLAWVAWTDWPSALVLLVLVALVPVSLAYFGRRSATQTRRQWRRLSSLSAHFVELVEGLPTLRALGRASTGRREVAEATEGLRATTMTTLRVAFLSALALEFLAGLGTGLVAMVLGLRLLGGTVSLTTALAVLLVSPEIFLPLRRAGAEFHASTEGQAAAERILEVLDLPEPEPAGGRSEASVPDGSAATLQLDSVVVRYPGRTVPALDGFSMTVAPGEHVALVGPSGSGKSTALSLLVGLIRPESGAVRIDGIDLASLPTAAWRAQVAWVPQRPSLFCGTLGANVALANPTCDEERLRWALELAGLGRVVAELPAGLDTLLGAEGLTLSAGERARLALARAIVRDAPVVLLDEPAAHLDPATEGRLADALAGWFEERTVVVAAHRPEIVTRLDRIVTLAGLS